MEMKKPLPGEAMKNSPLTSPDFNFKSNKLAKKPGT